MSARPTHRTLGGCRICDGALWPFLDLGAMPLANAFRSPAEAGQLEERYPLEVLRCRECGLVQLGTVVDPVVLFSHYLYASSASPPAVGHFAAYAQEVAERFAPPGSLVVEVGSNDGILLRPLLDGGVRALGIEPSRNLSAAANAAGLPTLNEFFGADVAARISAEKGRACAVVANNVLAHIDDLRGVAIGLDALLDQDGVFIAEFPYLLDLIEHVEYDTIYHEHLSYLSLAPLARLFAAVGMEPFDVRRVAVHGGSLRLFVGRAGRHPITRELEELRRAESSAGLDDPGLYRSFAARVARSRDVLLRLLRDQQKAGRRIAALGATAKGNTLLNYCGIGPEFVAWVADSTPIKHGLLTPGMHIPVRPERALLRERPDLTLLLAWNHAPAILERFQAYTNDGGRFIHPIPEARLIP